MQGISLLQQKISSWPWMLRWLINNGSTSSFLITFMGALQWVTRAGGQGEGGAHLGLAHGGAVPCHPGSWTKYLISFYFSALTCPAAAVALLLWRDWWLSSHFCLRLRALRRVSRLSALLFALLGAPFVRFPQFQVANGHQVIYIVHCTLFCIGYSRPAGQLVVARSLLFLPPFYDPLWGPVSPTWKY